MDLAALVVSVVLPLLGFAALWGSLGQRMKNVEEKTSTHETKIESLNDKSITREDLAQFERRIVAELGETIRKSIREEMAR